MSFRYFGVNEIMMLNYFTGCHHLYLAIISENASKTASCGSFKTSGNTHDHEVSQRLNLVVVTPLSLSGRGDLYGSFNIAVICCHCAGSCNDNLMLLKREEMVCIQLLRQPGQIFFFFPIRDRDHDGIRSFL